MTEMKIRSDERREINQTHPVKKNRAPGKKQQDNEPGLVALRVFHANFSAEPTANDPAATTVR
jgi:hypothetical protein